MRDQVDEILAANSEFRAGARCLQASIEVRGPSSVERFMVNNGEVGGDVVPERAVEIIMTITSEGWALLEDPQSVNMTLNRLFRLGHIDFGDGLHDVMHHWSALFWLTAAMRQSLSGTREV